MSELLENGLPLSTGLYAENEKFLGDLKRAFEFAIEAHKGQKRRQGEEAIFHAIRVSKKGSTNDEKIVGILHDALEKSSLTLDTLRYNGFSKEIVEAVDALTKREGESLGDYLVRVKKNPLALAVKLNDIEDNMDPVTLGLLPESEQKNLTAKYGFAKKVLLSNYSRQD